MNNNLHTFLNTGIENQTNVKKGELGSTKKHFETIQSVLNNKKASVSDSYTGNKITDETKYLDDLNKLFKLQFEMTLIEKINNVRLDKKYKFYKDKINTFITFMNVYLFKINFKKSGTLEKKMKISDTDSKFLVGSSGKEPIVNKWNDTTKVYIFKPPPQLSEIKQTITNIKESADAYLTDDDRYKIGEFLPKNHIIENFNVSKADFFALMILNIQHKCDELLKKMKNIDLDYGMDIDTMYEDMCTALNDNLQLTYVTFDEFKLRVENETELNKELVYPYLSERYEKLHELLDTNKSYITLLIQLMKSTKITKHDFQNTYKQFRKITSKTTPVATSSGTASASGGTISADIKALAGLIETYAKSNKNEGPYKTDPGTNEIIIRVFTNNTMKPEVTAPPVTAS